MSGGATIVPGEDNMKTLLAGLMAALCLVLMAPATIRIAAVGRTGASPGSAPDLIVRSDVLRDHWLVRVEDLPAGFCSVEEGNITPACIPSCGLR